MTLQVHGRAREALVRNDAAGRIATDGRPPLQLASLLTVSRKPLHLDGVLIHA
jgi:hypothetical protein